MVICLPSMVISPFFFIVIVADPVFSTISSPALIAIFLPTSSVSFSPTLVERSLLIEALHCRPDRNRLILADRHRAVIRHIVDCEAPTVVPAPHPQ